MGADEKMRAVSQNESVAMCAHLNVKYNPSDVGSGRKRDRWTCAMCGADFWPRFWLFPAPWLSQEYIRNAVTEKLERERQLTAALAAAQGQPEKESGR